MSTSSLLKGTLQTIILQLLAGNKMYGYEITQKVKELTNKEFQLTEGALYPALYKLEADGLVSASSELVDGRARKYYTLSEEGHKEAAVKLRDAASFITHLQTLLNLKPIAE